MHHRHYILLTLYVVLCALYDEKSPLYVGPGSLYYENFHYIIYMMSKHLYIMVDLHYMMGKHLYIMVDLHYMLIQPHYMM